MLVYRCKNCDDLECETSICPNCGKRTELVDSKIFWSSKYSCPCFYNDEERYEELIYIGKDARPVFPKERLLLEVLQGKPFEYAGKSFWHTTGNNYILDGRKIVIKYSDLISSNKSEDIIKEINKLYADNQRYEDIFWESEYILNFIRINNLRLSQITNEAINYISNETKGFKSDEMFVSFSGGKDSTVISDLVTRALETKKIIHIYCDTTLEYPKSKEYLQRFREKNREMPILVAKNNDQDFNDLCEVIGPPSRVMRWCCTVFKTGAITRKIESTFKDKKRIISFQGIRRNESVSRSKYERETESPKISKQLVIAPIIDWLDFDVWLYILSNRLDFNEAYQQGFARVGCWCCPNNSTWSGFLSSIYMNEEYLKFQDILYNFAKKVGKEDWKDYIDEGKWKARQGGNGLEASENAVVSFKPCVLEDDAYNFELTRPIDDFFYELFKPFGKLDFNIGNKRLNEVYVLDRKTNTPLLRLTGKKGSNKVKISVLKKTNIFKNNVVNENLLKCQITKFQTCLACGGCQSACKFDALKVMNTNKGSVSNMTVYYNIDTDRCVGCTECVNHFDSGCYMKKVLRTRNK